MTTLCYRFQSPIGRVSGCNQLHKKSPTCWEVSVPYWSGQWLQPATTVKTPQIRQFQSPIGRVSGCNPRGRVGRAWAIGFQSPIGRVSGCNASPGGC